MKKPLIFLAVLLMHTLCLEAQKRRDQTPVTYEELYDEPYAINKLFVQFQPVYGEMYVANINAGFGLEATYFWADKMTFRAHTRKTYTQKFDLTRDIATKNDNTDFLYKPNIFNYYEIGGTYHIKDFEESSTTKMFLYKKSYAGNRWASRVPLNAEIPCKIRKIYGGRLGGLVFDTSVNLSRVLETQGKTPEVLVSAEGTPLSIDQSGATDDVKIFSNMDVGAIYLGGSMTWIKNIAVDFDNKYQEGVDDLIFTAFLDLIVAPSVRVDDIIYQGISYSVEDLKRSIFGFRLGMDGKFNRTLSWAYGGEVGLRPGLGGQGFYALIKISFPVYSTNLDYSVEAFGK